jgi:5-methyltetrahydrofolate--homocysteine methyltransferase
VPEVGDQIAPTNRTQTLRRRRGRAADGVARSSRTLEDLSFRYVTFDQVKTAYAHQIRALIAGGVDTLMVETIFDSLNAKAALVAIREVFEADGVELPIQISAAVGPGGETMISGQITEAYLNAMRHVKPLVHRAELLARAGQDAPVPRRTRDEGGDCFVSAYPNAGMPNPLAPTGFDLLPPDMASFATGLRQIGLREHHGRLLRQHAGAHRRHRESRGRSGAAPCAHAGAVMRLSGSQPYNHTKEANYLMIGERTNVAGSPKFAKLIKEGKFEEAVAIARQQVENGANVIDICMDEGLIDGVPTMTKFLSLLQTEPEVAKVPSWSIPRSGRSSRRA